MTIESASAPRAFGLLLALFFFATACVVDVEDTHDGFPCNPDGSCELGMLCVDGRCERDPCAGVDCDPGEICVDGTCLDPCEGDPLVADAGDDQVVDPDSVVTLDGSGTSGGAPGELRFVWTQTAGTDVHIDGEDDAVPSFTAPSSSGLLTFVLEVTDSCGAIGDAVVQVQVRELPPIVVIDVPAAVNEGSSVTATGAGSYDPRGREIVGWTWAATWNEESIALMGASESTVHLTAPNVAGEVEPIELGLTVTNDLGESATEVVQITIRDVINNSPEAVAGEDQVAGELDTVSLDGSASFDPNGDEISFAWHQDVSDGSPSVTLEDAQTATPSFQVPRLVETVDLTFALTVDDGRGLQAVDSVIVTAERRIVALGMDVQPPAVLEAGQPFSIAVEILDVDGARETRAEDLIEISLSGGLGTELSGQTIRAAEGGVAVFDGLFVDTPGAGYQIQARTGLLQATNSDPFDVLPRATRLQVTSAPSPTAVAGEIFSVVVEARDEAGLRAVGFTGTVSLAIESGPVGGALLGTVSVQAAAGVATFGGLWLERAGTYTLGASAIGLTSGVSAPFELLPAPPQEVVFASAAQTLVAGECAAQVVLQPLDEYGNVSPPAQNTRIDLSSNSTSMEFFPAGSCLDGGQIGFVTLGAGQGSIAFLFLDRAVGSPHIDITPQGIEGDRQVQTIVPGAAAELIVVGQPPASVPVGMDFSVSVEARDSHGNLATTFTGQITIAILGTTNPYGATLLGTKTRDAVSGEVTFSGLSIDTEGAGYRLTVSALGVTGANTNAFDAYIAPVRMVITGEPPDPVSMGSPFTVSAVAVDGLGNLASAFDENVRISIASPPSPSGATLLGTTTVAAASGVVTFSNLRIDRSGSGFVLGVVDSAGQLIAADTISFTVRPFEGGSGTAIDPYRVGNVFQLQAVADHPTSHFNLFADIDASEAAGWGGVTDFSPIGTAVAPFTGSFDGGGHVVVDLVINRASLYGVGLFGVLGTGGSVQRVCVIDALVLGERQVGALVGENAGGTISQACSTGGVQAVDREAGGLVGKNSGTISDSYSTAAVHATGRRAGGLTGDNSSGRIERSFATGAVSGGAELGGLNGRGGPGGTDVDCFWDTQTSGQGSSVGGTGKTTAQMHEVRTFTDVAWSAGLSSPWDFFGNPYDDTGAQDIWDIDLGYPYLTAFE